MAGNLSRVAAVEIEALVNSAVRKRLDHDSTVHTNRRACVTLRQPI